VASGVEDSDPLADTAAASPSPHADTAAASPASLATPRPTAGALTPEMKVGRYVIDRRLGAGGMGTVYAAHDPELARNVAIKILHPNLAHQRALLLGEARTVAKLRHRNIVTVHDVGTHDDGLFIAMELLEGPTLRAWLATKRSWDELADAFGQAGRALAAAHAAGVVHRDFKPDNVLLDRDGRVVVTDFGLARILGNDRRTPPDLRVSAAGAILGTPAYMSPEQFRGEKADERSDQFSFAVALFEAAFEKMPFRGNTFDELRDNVLAGVPADSPDGRIPSRCRAAILRALSGEPAARFASIDALLRELEPVSRRRRWSIIAAGAVLVAAVTTAAVLRGHSSSAPRAASIELAPEQPLGSVRSRGGLELLRDGRILRLEGSTIQVEELGGAVAARIPSPDGRLVLSAFGTGQPDVIAVATGEAQNCQWWRMQLSSQHAEKLGTAEECLRSTYLGYDGQRIALGYGREGLVVQDAASGQRLWSKPMLAATPVFSPDGRRLVVEDANVLVVLDAATGDEIFRTHAATCAWLDADHLLYSATSDEPAMRLAQSVVNLATFSPTETRTVLSKDEPIYRASQRIVSLSASRDGIIVGTVFGHRSLYIIPTRADAPLRLESTKPENTGAVNDYQAIAWTRAGEVVSEGNVRDRSVYMKTKPGGRGTVLATLEAGSFGRGTVTGDKILFRAYLRGGENSCVLGTVGVETGAVSEWRRGDCHTEPVLRCATSVPKCLLTAADGAGSASWFDPETRAIGEPAPIIPGALAPDGSSYAIVDPDLRITIHSLDGKETAAITPTPVFSSDFNDVFSSDFNDVTYWPLEWMPDGRSLLLVLGSIKHPSSRLVELQLDGTWRTLATSESEMFVDPVPSPDATQVAVVASPTMYTWSLLPILAVH
jgi:hypothetical protein